MTKNRILTFTQAINEAQYQAMELDKSVFVFGLGVDKTSHVFSTTLNLKKKFGSSRVFDTPISEQALTMFAAGSANAGMRPVLIHQRVDFMIYSFDQLVNWISLWSFKSAGKSKMPLVIRAIVGKGWGQCSQHAKSLHSIFGHVPGLKVIIPSSPSEAKGLLLSSIFSNDPIIFIEYRSLYNTKENVSQKPYYINLDEPSLVTTGKDITIVSVGSGVLECIRAKKILSKEGISIEIIDTRSVSTFNFKTILSSVKKTKRLIVVEEGWSKISYSSEIISRVVESGVKLKTSPSKITWPSSHIPMSNPLEKMYYFNKLDIVNRVRKNVKN